MTTRAKTNNFSYLIDPTFNKVNKFVLSFEKKKIEHILTSIKHQKLK